MFMYTVAANLQQFTSNILEVNRKSQEMGLGGCALSSAKLTCKGLNLMSSPVLHKWLVATNVVHAM